MGCCGPMLAYMGYCGPTLAYIGCCGPTLAGIGCCGLLWAYIGQRLGCCGPTLGYVGCRGGSTLAGMGSWLSWGKRLLVGRKGVLVVETRCRWVENGVLVMLVGGKGCRWLAMKVPETRDTWLGLAKGCQ